MFHEGIRKRVTLLTQNTRCGLVCGVDLWAAFALDVVSNPEACFQEGGTFLAALPCPSRGCAGPVLPAAPLSLTGPWRCAGCALHVPSERATLLQSVLGGLLQTLYLDPGVPPQPGAILRFLEDNRHLLPATNHITVELKSDVVWSLGRKPGLSFPGEGERGADCADVAGAGRRRGAGRLCSALCFRLICHISGTITSPETTTTPSKSRDV